MKIHLLRPPPFFTISRKAREKGEQCDLEREGDWVFEKKPVPLSLYREWTGLVHLKRTGFPFSLNRGCILAIGSTIQRLLCIFFPSESCAHLFQCYLVPCLFKPSDLRSDGCCVSCFCSLHLICFGPSDLHPVTTIAPVVIKSEPSDLSDGLDLSRLIFFCFHYIFTIFLHLFTCVFLYLLKLLPLKKSIEIFSFLVTCLFFYCHLCHFALFSSMSLCIIFVSWYFILLLSFVVCI